MINKEVTNLVKPLGKNDSISTTCHADVSHEIGVGGIPWKIAATKKDLRKYLKLAETLFMAHLVWSWNFRGITEPAIIKKLNHWYPQTSNLQLAYIN